MLSRWLLINMPLVLQSLRLPLAVKREGEQSAAFGSRIKNQGWPLER